MSLLATIERLEVMAAVDLTIVTQLERIFAEPASEDAHRCCSWCNASYSLDDETEESLFCHNCAHFLAEDTMPQLLDELRTLRASAEAHAKLVDALQWLPRCEISFADEQAFLEEVAEMGWVYQPEPLPSPPEKGST